MNKLRDFVFIDKRPSLCKFCSVQAFESVIPDMLFSLFITNNIFSTSLSIVVADVNLDLKYYLCRVLLELHLCELSVVEPVAADLQFTYGDQAELVLLFEEEDGMQ
jgi:hypothetical protein